MLNSRATLFFFFFFFKCLRTHFYNAHVISVCCHQKSWSVLLLLPVFLFYFFFSLFSEGCFQHPSFPPTSGPGLRRAGCEESFHQMEVCLKKLLYWLFWHQGCFGNTYFFVYYVTIGKSFYLYKFAGETTIISGRSLCTPVQSSIRSTPWIHSTQRLQCCEL